MSRYAINEPDPDQYEAKPVEDIDVPDFDAPDQPVDPPFTRVQQDALDAFAGAGDPPVDPTEHAAQAAMSGLHALELLVVGATDVEQAQFLKKLTKQLAAIADRIDLKASAKIDECMERRR